MQINYTPVDYLIAFAIAFAAGVLTAVGVGKYIEKIKRDAMRLDAFAVGRVGKLDGCWCRVAGWPVITHISPQACGFGLAVARC